MKWFYTITALVIGLSAQASQQDIHEVSEYEMITKGAAIFKRCVSCHGRTGGGSAGYTPRLAGQAAWYLERQIKDIKEGRRKNGNVRVMLGVFSSLSEAEIKAVSKYLQKKKLKKDCKK